MAYATGTASSLSDLRTAIINACTANGWSLSGDVLSRGGCYVRLQVLSGGLQILGGNGESGGNVTTPGPRVCRIGELSQAPLAWPMTYHVFINTNPDEVYVVVNYSSVFFQWMAWGRSEISLPGSGNWYGATLGPIDNFLGGISLSQTIGGLISGNSASSGGLFWTNAQISNQNSHIHHGLDGAGWSDNLTATLAQAIGAASTLISISPNAWNSEAVLIPIPVCILRPSNFYSIVLQNRHARYTRVDNLSAGQVLTIASDQWMVFPWLCKNTESRNGSSGSVIGHSGTFGWAIRYTP